MSLHIPGYRILRTLGKGGMATVYLAVQDIFERQVALKVMAQGLADDPAFGKRFFREARIVSQLVHPNIVTVFDVGVHEGAYYLSMEYIEGQDLKQARKQLNLTQKIQAVQDIARALDFAASKGYVHRDIKPENIMIASADRRAVLMDFGIARAAETDLSVTQTGLAIGTPHYMSPEQAKGKAVDARSDLYSLGVVFYLLLTGKVPFDGDSAVAIGIKHITELPPELPESLAPAVPILHRLLAKTPGERYQQAADLVAALEELKPLLQDVKDAKPAHEEEGPPPAWANAATLVEVGAGLDPYSVDSLTALESAPTGPVAAATEGTPIKPSGGVNGGLTWFGVGVILTLAATSAAFTLWYVNKPKPAASFATLTAGANKDVRQLKENIALVSRAYQKSEAQLPVLVKLYRDLQKLHPDDPAIEEELTALAQQQLKRLTWALNLADYEQAALLDKNLRMLFPEFISDEFNRQEARLTLAGQIQTLLATAKDYTKQGAMSQPAGANAQETYEAVLALDSEVAPAREALANIRQQTKGTNAKFAVPGSPQGQLLNTGDKLVEAKRLADKGQLFAPVGQNAHELLAQILSKDPGNPAARETSLSLWQSLPGWANRWVKEGAYNMVNQQLSAASELKPNDKNLQQLHQSVDEKIVERNRALLPQVTGLRVAGFPVESFDEPQANSLSASRHLHLRLALANAQAQGLKINLYEGARSRLVTQLSVEVKEGLSQAKIEAPAGGFGKGAFTLDVLANGQIVETQRFRIE